MPEFDKYFMPPSVTVSGQSMFDDNIAFALMADNASAYSAKIPLSVKLAYGLPYASYHESRVNWRPLFFAKFFQLVVGSTSTHEAITHLAAPNVFLNWTSNVWASHPAGWLVGWSVSHRSVGRSARRVAISIRRPVGAGRVNHHHDLCSSLPPCSAVVGLLACCMRLSVPVRTMVLCVSGC